MSINVFVMVVALTQVLIRNRILTVYAFWTLESGSPI